MESLINYDALWTKVGDYGRKAGRVATRPLLSLYYVLKSHDTPMEDKLIVWSALSYLVLPIDLLNGKRLPDIGWLDEAAAIMIAYRKVRKHITPEIEMKVENVLDKWFPVYTEYVEISAE